MSADWRNLSGYNPFWSNLWGMVGHGAADAGALAGGAKSLTLPAGITLVTASPAHPHASTLGEKVLKFDLNSATHEQYIDNDSGATITGVIDNSKRWGVMIQFLLYLDSTKLPTGDWKIMGALQSANDTGAAADWKLEGEASTGKPKLYVNNTLVATGSAAFTLDAWRYVELWHIFNATGGADLATDQWVVRSSSAATGAVSWTTLINANVNSSNALVTQIAYFGRFYLGATDAEGAGKEMNLANISSGWQDADNPLGILRMDFMTPNGETANAAYKDANGGTGGTAPTDGTRVDDCAVGGATDDGTTVDEYASATAVTVEQMYTMDTPAYATGSDIIIGVRHVARSNFFAVGKGGSAQLWPIISDGTTLITANGNDSISQNDNGAYISRIHTERLDPSSALWTAASLAGLECGVQITKNAVAVTTRWTAHTAMIPYQLSTETGTAVDAPNKTVGRLIQLNQAVKRSGFF